MEIMYEVRQKISNHSVLTDLERDVVVYRTADNKTVITREYLDIRIPKPPTTGEYTLKSINGVVSWVAE